MPQRGLVPYITSWSAEKSLPATVIELRGRIGYADEAVGERDEHGVLWSRVPSLPGRGQPLFGKIHALRQRRAMRRLLCQVCAGPADESELGMLWLVPDFREDWPGWPEHMGCTEPPVCLACARVSVRVCPALRKGYVAIRVGRSAVSGIYGARYRPGFPYPTPTEDRIVSYEDPDIGWTRAGQLVRELLDCTIVNL